MAIIGTVTDAFIEDGRVIAILSLGFQTHSGNYRADITPSLNPGGEFDEALSINLKQFARDAIGTSVRIDNPSILDELIKVSE